jgi:lipoprotein-anchoring transpeptidase ErfK/SrfK
MKQPWLFCAIAGLLLSSPTPPASSAFELPPQRVALESIEPKLPYERLELASELTMPPEAPTPAPVQETFAEPETLQEEEEPAPPSSSGVQVVVSIPQQKAYVFQDGELFGTTPVSTGKRGHETPTGTFRILQKKVHHRSNLYANAPMPYMQRLTWYGIALHAGHVPGYPASHGCIRLPKSFAKKLYGITDSGTVVTIVNKRLKSAEEALSIA